MGVEHFIVDRKHSRVCVLGKGMWSLGFPYDTEHWCHASVDELRRRVKQSWEGTHRTERPDDEQWYWHMATVIWAFCTVAEWQVEHVNDGGDESFRRLSVVASRYMAERLDPDPCADQQSRALADARAQVLLYRRAKFVYEGARLAAIASKAPIVPEPYDEREEAFRVQFEQVIARQTGPERSVDAEALHEDWVRAYEKMGWVYGPARDPEKKTHPDMVPYRELGQLERDKDSVFVALCEIARRWVYDE